MNDDLSIGIITDWLVTYAGSEKVVAEFINVLPQAELYAVIDYLSHDDRKNFHGKKAKTSFVQHLPFAKQKYQSYLPIMPFAVEQLDVSSHDIILSSSHAVAKGILTGPDQLHISYIHSPIRYAWDLQHQYLHQAGLERGIKSLLARIILYKMRLWDIRTSNGVDYFIANSNFIARRIKKVYGRNSDVIYPPVDVNRFTLETMKEDFYLTASRLVPYKKIDIIVEAFSSMPDKKLIVIGDGTDMEKIKKKAGRNIEILGYQSNEVLEKYMKKAKAFVFAAEEDFGITAVEAQACGTPIIAFGKGGALETVRPFGVSRPTGFFFEKQNAKSIIDAVNNFEFYADTIDPKDCRHNALKFSVERFNFEIKKYVNEKWQSFNESKRVKY
ncbi:glycosyltransferase family 4 protein [Pluralibacter gergoviae]|uniref:Glycosyltransferase family 4 protein n=1 Tax=Pluralibacter gergoviae TaxID=61647 RepID=A0AAW8HNW6_PLUGE|nr:glycosyltransferase family 4 protein [Pluralibacter gergoviae]AIR00758.1 glycosyl transferase family 1 [Pluralibacter gergoviae]AVR05024.1 glycosyltransferase family 4 protein [Pluralibacter gergoviae]MDQ2309074.1 glycosyltransferase family 4 protein [Pluralibacter gergoviae]